MFIKQVKTRKQHVTNTQAHLFYKKFTCILKKMLILIHVIFFLFFFVFLFYFTFKLYNIM